MMYLLKNILIFFMHIFIFGVEGNNENLVTVIQIFRHGQRTPFEFSPNDPHSNSSLWTAGRGQLVNEGKVQQYELGKWTRQRYDGFLPSLYNSRDIYVQTTDEDRTHMSAQSNLAGLYPPVQKDVWNNNILWQPIPVHIAEKNILWLECDAMYQLLQDEFSNIKPMGKINKNYSYVYDFLSKHTGSSINTIFSVFRLYDTMSVEILNKMELPSWAYTVYPEPLHTISVHALEAHCYTNTLKKICVGRLLKDILDHFDIMLEDSSRSYKLKVYSSHDKNVGCLLKALGAFTPHIPGFASSIYIELRKNKDEGYVNIWYKNSSNIEPLTVKGCSFNCTLSEFRRLVGKYAVTEEEYKNICSVKKNDRHKKRIDPSEVWGGYTHISPYK